MGMKRIFQKAAMTAFKVAGDLKKSSSYYLERIDDGFGAVEDTRTALQLIVDRFSEEEAHTYSFSDLIQLKDMKGMVPYLSCARILKNGNCILVEGETTYTIVAQELDAASALYILLLRKV